eukprot:3650558-Amphidinium_carterae.1
MCESPAVAVAAVAAVAAAGARLIKTNGYDAGRNCLVSAATLPNKYSRIQIERILLLYRKDTVHN